MLKEKCNQHLGRLSKTSINYMNSTYDTQFGQTLYKP
jgi:hypothetical protein